MSLVKQIKDTLLILDNRTLRDVKYFPCYQQRRQFRRLSCIGERAAAALREVDDGVVPWFREAAKQLLEDYTDPEEAMARALAKVTGHTKLQVHCLPSIYHCMQMSVFPVPMMSATILKSCRRFHTSSTALAT